MMIQSCLRVYRQAGKTTSVSMACTMCAVVCAASSKPPAVVVGRSLGLENSSTTTSEEGRRPGAGDSLLTIVLFVSVSVLVRCVTGM